MVQDLVWVFLLIIKVLLKYVNEWINIDMGTGEVQTRDVKPNEMEQMRGEYHWHKKRRFRN